MSLNDQFVTVSNQVKNWTKKPADSENLALYSLFKQATVGDCNIATPSDLVGKAKWNAWNERKGISQDDAKKQYIDLAQQWQSKYA